MAKTELTDNQTAEVKAALLAGEPVPNASGGVLVFDGKVDGYWRKATPEEARDHESTLDAVTVANRKAPAGNDNP